MPNTVQNTSSNYNPFGSAIDSRAFACGGDRYGFNGFEKDDEVKGAGNWYTFGDYGYDPRIVQRPSPDPHTSDYPYLSPYAAFGNNPIIFIDPDGRDIILAAGLTTAQKLEIAGNLQKLTNDKLVYKTLKDGTTQVKVASLAKSGTETKVAGTNLIRQLNSSEKTVTIDYQNSLGHFTDGKENKAKATNYTDAANGTGSDAIVNFDPTSNPSIPTEDPKTGNVSGAKRPNYIGLGHELIHADHYMDGDYSPTEQKASHTYKDATGKTVTQTHKKEELRTVGLAGNKKGDITENKLRKENKLNKRGAY